MPNAKNYIDLALVADSEAVVNGRGKNRIPEPEKEPLWRRYLRTFHDPLIIVLLVNSTYGRAFKAVRDDEVAAEAMGINLAKHKQLSFCISSFFAGVGGALFAMFASTVQAKTFTSAMTYEILLIVVIGGIGSISGSCLASFLYIACSEWWLRFLDNTMYIGGTQVPLLRNGFRMVVFSVIIMIVVLFFRQGIMGNRELPDLFRRKRVKEGKSDE